MFSLTWYEPTLISPCSLPGLRLRIRPLPLPRLHHHHLVHTLRDWILDVPLYVHPPSYPTPPNPTPASPHQSIQYGSLFLSISGTYTVAPTVSAWGANNVFPHTRRATAIAIGFIMSNSGGILATWLLGSLSAAPRYHSATVTMLIMSVLMIVFTGLNLGYLWSQNKKKAQIRATSTQVEERPGLGDRSAWFIYSL